MSNKLTKQDRATVERILSDFRRNNQNLLVKEFVDRWETTGHFYSEKILKSLKRQANKRKKLRPNEEFFHAIDLDLMVLLSQIGCFVEEMKEPVLRPKERQEIIDRIGASAKQIIRDMVKIDLPSASTPYFTRNEIQLRYAELLPILGLSKLVEEAKSFDYEAASAIDIECLKSNGNLGESEPMPQLKDLRDAKRNIGAAESFWHVPFDLSVAEVLVKLTDEKLLDSLAYAADVSRTESKNYERIFMIRKLTQFFKHRYGEVLQETVGRICLLIFDDESIDRDTVRSALAGFSPRTKYKQMDFGFYVRHADILGKLEAGLLEKELSQHGQKT